MAFWNKLNQPCSCGRIAQLLEESGNQGVSVILSEKNKVYSFYLQFRVCDEKKIKDFGKLMTSDKEKIREADLSPITLNAEVKLKFCPHCGDNLNKWIGRNGEKVTGLALKHKELKI